MMNPSAHQPGVLAPYVLGFPMDDGQQDPSYLYQSSAQDEAETILAAQEEWASTQKKHVKRKQREEMASRLLSLGEHPGKDFFKLLAQKLQEYQVATPSVQIEYRNLTVKTQALVGDAGIPTAGNFAPRLVKAALGLDKSATRELTVLDGLTGVLKPGRCTLLMGPPGGGKTTFLKVLGNRLRGATNLQVSGDVVYNGCTKDEFVVERTTAFVDQHDMHLPNMTVAETVEFAHTCHRGYREPEFSLSTELCRAKVKSVSAAIQQAAQCALPVSGAPEHYPSARMVNRVNPAATNACIAAAAAAAQHGQPLEQQQLQQGIVLDEVEQLIMEAWGTGVKTEVVLRLLGLGHCRDTLVGDGGLMLRGVSGGERKRLTTAEMVVGPQRVLLMDEISTGLDSATLFSVITFFTSMSHALNLTTIISLLQPPPEVFHLFDDLLLLAGGRMLYHGPLQDALPHFTAMGFDCPERKDVPSWVMEITTPPGQLAYASKRLLAAVEGAGGAPSQGLLLNLDQMASSFWNNSAAGSAMAQQLSEPFDRSSSHPAALEQRRYALSPLQAVAVVTRRQMKLVMRDRVLLRGRLLQILCVSLMVGSLFFRLGHTVTDARSFYGAAFMVVLFMSMGTMPQIGVVMAQKGVWLKHRDNLLYPGYAHGLAMALSQLPVSMMEATLFSCITYFMVGFYPGAGYFFIFWLVVASSNLCLSALFRLLAVLAPNPMLAAAYGGVALLVLILTSGFAIVRGSIPPYWIWAYYLSPFAYALRALVVNEFTSPQWTQKVIGVPGASTMGKAALLSFDFYGDRSWIGTGILFLVASYLVFSAATCWALGWVAGPQPRARLPSPGQLAAVREAAMRRRSSTQQMLAGGRASGTMASLSQLSKASKKLVSRLARREGSVAGADVIVAPAAAAVCAGAAIRRHSSSKGDGAGSAAPDKAAGGHYAGKPAEAHGLASSKGGAWPAWSGSKLRMLRSVFRLSDTGEVGTPSTVKINLAMDGRIPFTPITLVFQELSYFVPNPSFHPLGCGMLGRATAGGSGGATKAYDTEAPGHAMDSAHSFQAAIRSKLRWQPQQPWAAPAAAARAAAGDPGLAPPRELELLKGVTAYAVPGVLTALMGGSGAGKTTLMDVICGRKTVGRVSGSISVNGHAMVRSTWSRVVGYVEQVDVHSPAQTVLEALWFSSRLRLGPHVSDQQVRAHVEHVIDMVDLTDQACSLVGAPGGHDGLSSEQQKRLTIAVELVANPSVVFCDEPTSGLDARAAAIVMRAVRNVALSGRTVMVTIHQPSIDVFEAFDMLLLLQRGGRVTYFGPLGAQSQQLISYLQAVPGTTPITPGHNPAAWMLEVTGGSMAMVAAPNMVDWPGIYAASSLAAGNAAEAQRLVQEGAATNPPLTMSSMYAQPLRVQVRELLAKYWMVYWRTPSYTLARCALTLCVAFIYGSMYYKAGVLPRPYASMGSVQNIMGIMFSSTNFLGMTNLMAVMPLMGMERVVFYRERAALPYDAFAWGTAIGLVDVPYLIVQALLFVPVIYVMVGFQASAEKFFYYLLMFLASISFYTIFGQLLVSITPSQQIAQVAGAGLNFIFNIFNGFVIAYPAMPAYWRWLNRVVPTTWVLYGLGASQLGDVAPQQVQFAGRRMTVSAFTRKLFDYDYDMRWWCLLIMVVYVMFFRVASILALRYLNFLKR